jgi:hypothetical protein
MPTEYQAREAEYQAAYKVWQAERERIQNAEKNIEMKINMGSDKALQTIIDQADNLATLTLTMLDHKLLGNEGGSNE